jgi:hypothetical protein
LSQTHRRSTRLARHGGPTSGPGRANARRASAARARTKKN